MQIELKELHRSLGLTTVFVTHDQEEAMSLSDRIVLMNGGVIDQAASPDEINKAPRTAFAADFIGAANLLPAERVGDLARLRGSTVAVPVQGTAGTGIGDRESKRRNS